MKYKETIIFAFIFILTFVAFFCFFKDANDFHVGIFIAIFGGNISFYFGFLKYSLENDRTFKELFREFNEKYDTEFNDLINELVRDSNKKLDNNEKNKIIDYFNLCSEEYLWYTRKRIPNKVWYAWENGIIGNLKIKQIRELYKSEINNEEFRESYYGLIERLNYNKKMVQILNLKD